MYRSPEIKSATKTFKNLNKEFRFGDKQGQGKVYLPNLKLTLNQTGTSNNYIIVPKSYYGS